MNNMLRLSISLSLIFVFLLISNISCKSNKSSDNLLTIANNLFQKKQYQESLQIYDSILVGNMKIEISSKIKRDANIGKMRCLIYLHEATKASKVASNIIDDNNNSINDDWLIKTIDNLLSGKDSHSAYCILKQYRYKYPNKDSLITELEKKCDKIYKESDEYKTFMKNLQNVGH